MNHPCFYKHIILFLLLSTLLGAPGCREDLDLFRPYPPTKEEILATLAQVPNPSTQTVVLFNGLNKDTVIHTASGLRIFLEDVDNLFTTESGMPVPASTCTSLRMDVLEVLNNTDLVARHLPAFKDEALIETAGILQLGFQCNGSPLTLKAGRYIKVQLPSANLRPDMQLLYGAGPDSPPDSWSAAAGQPSVFLADWSTPQGAVTGYEILLYKLGWINCARLVSAPGAEYCVSLPPGYDGDNSVVIVLFKDLHNSVILQPTETNQLEGVFCIENAPVDYPVQIIAISKLGDQYFLGNQTTFTGANAETSIQPFAIPRQELIAFLQNL